MDILACVLFHMDSGHADTLLFTIHFNVDMTVFADGQLELGNLVSLWQIGIKIVLTRKTDFKLISQFVAIPILDAYSATFSFSTGNTPGMPEQTRQTFSLGSLPNLVEQEQKSWSAS